MEKGILTNVLQLRFVVGFLGESAQPPWWPSAFLSSTSQAFLAPVFARTPWLAAYHGVVAAAAGVHDQRIGIGANVFHLFRLPEHLEQELHAWLTQAENTTAVSALVNSPETALDHLRQCADNTELPTAGPVRVGGPADLGKATLWRKTAQHYLYSFRGGLPAFPFISEGS